MATWTSRLQANWPTIIPACILVCLAPLYAEAIRAAGIGMIHDDGVYVVTGKALAEGRGYRIPSLPDEPLQTKYPVVLPLFLSLVWRIAPQFPENQMLLKAVPAPGLLGWGWVTYSFLRNRAKLSASEALWILTFVALNQWCLLVTSAIMSETIFGFFAMAALAWLAAACDRQGTTKTTLSAALLAGAAYQTRTMGIALIVVGIAALAAKRKLKQAAFFAMVTGGIVIAWMLWQSQAGDPHMPVEAYYTAQNYRDWNVFSGKFSISQGVGVVLTNAAIISLYPAQWVFSIPLPEGTHYGFLAVVSIPFWICLVRGLRRVPSTMYPVSPFILASAGTLVLWAWPPLRFLLSVLPLLLVYAYYGLPQRARAFVPALAVVPGVMVMLFVQNTVSNGVAEFVSTPWAARAPVAGMQWEHISSVHRWMAEHTDRDTVILANYDPVMYLYSGRKSIRPFLMHGPGLFYGVNRTLQEKQLDFDRIIQKYNASYIAETGHDERDEPDYYAILAGLHASGRILLVKEFAPKYRIYKVVANEQRGKDR